MHQESLARIARELVADNKGLLAADESTNSITKHFDALGIASTPETRRAYREMLFTAPGIESCVSGIILFDETIRQKTSDGILFPEYLKKRGIIPGIKVDTGTRPLYDWSRELVTEGLEGLPERLDEYVSLGARFAKWRAVILVGDHVPTRDSLLENAERLARYALICQEKGVVPIVEPEVLMDGEQTEEQCYEVTRQTHRAVFAALRARGVYLPGMLLKTNMVVSGVRSHHVSPPTHVAKETVRLLKETVPHDIPGVVFLSGGQSEVDATARLQAMNTGYRDLPWKLTFSYGRALQQSAMRAWGGHKDRVTRAQEIFLLRARLNSQAAAGKYKGER